MPKRYSSKQIIKTLLRNGFFIVSQKGPHVKLQTKTLPKKTTIIPTERKEIPYGTFQAILIQSQLTKNDFM